MLTLKLAFSYYKQRKVRFILTLLSITIAVTSLITVQGLNGSLNHISDKVVKLIGGNAQLEVKGPISGLERKVLEEVKDVEGIKNAIPFIQAVTSMNDVNDLVLIMGINPKKDKEVRSYTFFKGRMPIEGREISITKTMSKDYNFNIGDFIKVQGTKGYKDFKVVGIIDDTGIGSMNSGLLSIIPLDTSQEFFNMKNKYSYISLILDDPNNIDTVKEKVENQLDKGLNVASPQGRRTDLDQMLGMITGLSNLFAILILFLGIYIVYNTMMISIAEQREQIGMLRAMGWNKVNVEGLILLEALILGLVGSVIGLLLGSILADNLLVKMAAPLEEVLKMQIPSIDLSFSDYTYVGLIGILSTLIFSYLPARKISKIHPIEAMKKEFPNESNKYSKLRSYIGLLSIFGAMFILLIEKQFVIFSPILLVIGIILLIPPLIIKLLEILEKLLSTKFGVSGKLGTSAFRRLPKRTALTGMPIFLALTISFSFLSLTNSLSQNTNEWVKETIASDIVVHQGFSFNINALSGLSEDLLERISSIEGVDYVFGIKTDEAKWNNKAINIQAIDIEGWSKSAEHAPVINKDPKTAINELKKSGTIWISELIANNYNIKTGEIIELDTPSGTQEFKVVAIYKDFSSLEGTFQINRKDYIKYWQTNSLTFVDVFVKPEFTYNEVREKIIDDLDNEFDLKVDLATSLREDTISSLKSMTGIVDMIVLISILVSAVSIINSLLISVLEQTKVIGTLRSLGMTKLQIQTMFFIEIGTLLLAAFLLSLPISMLIYITGVIYQQEIIGLTLESYIPFNQLYGVLIALTITAIISTIYPAWKASKINPIEALKSE